MSPSLKYCPAHKGLSIIMLVRAGVAKVRTARAFHGGRYKTDYEILDPFLLETWGLNINRLFTTIPDGPHQLCIIIFGQAGTAYLAERGQFNGVDGSRPAAIALRAIAQRASAAAGPSNAVESEGEDGDTEGRHKKRRKVYY